MMKTLLLVGFVFGSVVTIACGEGPAEPSLQTGSRLPPPFIPASTAHKAIVTSYSTMPASLPTLCRELTIPITVDITNPVIGDSIYWNTQLLVNGSPNTVPPGTITPRSGGPIPAGTTVTLTYTGSTPPLTALVFVTSLQPVDNPSVEPADGERLGMLLMLPSCNA
jgi:hypothetical protein